MSRIVYLNGEYLPLEQAKISVMDRGFLFADGIYEVSAVIGGQLVDNEAHLARLERSLVAIGIPMPLSFAELARVQHELIKRNSLGEGLIYIQVTRGVAEREFAYPQDLKPTLVMFTQNRNILANPRAITGLKVVTVPDIRWDRRDIKSIALLAQVLAKQSAHEKGADEAWMVQDGFVTEGGSSTAFIVTRADIMVTRPLSNDILPGITRQAVLAMAKERGLTLEERAFSVHEALGAAEAFLTSATSFVMPVVEIDGKPVADGKPGSVTVRLREIYIDMARGQRARA